LLEYLEDIRGLLRTCRRLLKPHGRLTMVLSPGTRNNNAIDLTT
jgi:tRNA1(Val) A37 N6-methylase TrmN6